MNKKLTRFMAFLMSILMIVTILPTEYLLSNAMEVDKNTLSFVSTDDSEVKIENNQLTIDAQSYKKDYEIKTQFNYAIDYSTKDSFAPGEIVYMMPSLGFYDNGVTAGYILPTDISVNNSGTDIWSYETTTIGDSKVIKITNNITLTPEIVTEGYMQFATTINPRTMLLGNVTLNNVVMLMSDDGGKTAAKSNQLSWNYNLHNDEFEISEEVKDVQVENAKELGEDANDYYWAKYEVNVSTDDAKLHSLQANNFKMNFNLIDGAILYSVNGNKDVSTTNNTFSKTFNVSDWNYTQDSKAKTFSIIVKYPKSKFDGNNVSNNVSLDVQYIGSEEYQKDIANTNVNHELHDYNVKYDGDLFAVNTNKNAGYEISWNSLNRGEASPFSYYVSGLSRYNGSYSATITDDALEILTTNGFYRLDKDEYAFNKVIVNDLSHFTNSIGEQYTSLDFAIIANDDIVKTGTITNNSQTIVLPENTTNVSIAFYDLNSSLYLDSTAIQVVGAIDLKDSSTVLKEGELRNLVNLIVVDENDEVMNKVDASNYTGSDASRLAQLDMDDYGMYLQRGIDSLVVTNKSSQINVTTEFNPSTSTYNKDTQKQDSKLNITSFFAAPGEVNSFSLYDILPKDMKYLGTITFTSDADLKLADGTTIAKENVNEFLQQHATINTIDNYKSSDRTYVSITFNFEEGKGICYDSTMTNGFTSGKITSSLDVEVPNVDATYSNVVGMIFNDEHHETITKTKDDGSASLVKNDGVLWVDIDNDGDVNEIVDYAIANLTSVYVKADNTPVEPTKTPNVSITKTSDKEVYKNGETIVYTIKVTNTGETTLTNVVVTESLNGTFDNQDGIKINNNVVTIDSMNVGESKTLTYRVAIPANSKDGDIVKNIVNVTTNEGVKDEAKKDVKVEVPSTPITPTKTPKVSITKTSDKEVYKNGETIVYTIKVTNTGETTLTNVIVTESLNGTFDNQNGIKVNGNVVTIDSMNVEESRTLTYRVAVPTNSKDGDIVKNIVNVTTNEGVKDEAKKDVKVEVPSAPITPSKTPRISITKTSDKEVYKNGETIVYTIKVTNTGETTLTNVIVTESLNGTFDNQDEIKVNGNIVTIDSMNVGESKTLTYRVVVPTNSKDGDIVKNIVNVITNEGVKDEAKKDVKVEVPITPKDNPSLAIVKTSDKATYYPNETITYTIKVTNDGNIDLKNVKVIETLNGTWKDVSNNVNIVDDKNATIKDLKVGQTETLTYVYVVPSDAQNNSSIKNIVKAKEDTHNLNVSDDVTVTIIEKENPALSITKTADKKTVKTGDTITYTIVVKNNGNVDLTNVNVVDSLTNGKFVNVDDTITKVNDYTLIIPTLKAGESKTFTFTYVVDKDTTAKDITNIATAIETSHSLRVEDKVVVEITKPLIETIPEIVQTGDNAPIFIFLGLAIVALIGMCVITKVSSKRK